MDFEPTEYVRKSFNVKAEEVTYENIEAVAEWCKGRVDSESTKILGGNEVKLPVVILAGQGEDKGKEIVARLGYFVVYSKGRFRVYKAPQFHASFEQAHGINDNGECKECGLTVAEPVLHDNSSIDGQETVMVNLGGQNLL